MTAEEKKSPGKDSGKGTFKSNKKHGGRSPTSVMSLNSDTAVPMLRLGVNNNFDNFKKKVSIACMEKYKNLGRLIVDEAYFEPPAVDPKVFNLSNDPHDIEKGRLKEAHKHRDKEINDMKIDRTSMFAYLISKLSKESLDEVQGDEAWSTIESSRDPLELWKVIKATHQILTTSKVASVIKKTAREEYAACKQGAFEHIVDYKRKFDARYADFKAEIVNDMQKGTLTTQIDDLNKMYILASRRVVVKIGDKSAGGATFTTVDNNMAKKLPKDDKAKTKEQKYAEHLAKMKCFNCGEKGHPAKSCPKKAKKEDEEEEDDEPPMAGMTVACCVTSRYKCLHDYFKVCLDNGSQVSIVDSRLLINLRTACRTYHSMNGVAHTERIGYLEGFFDCQACDSCPTNIISMARVEDIYPLTYSQGESITVHMDDRDLVFKRREGMYVADFSDWIVEDEERMKEVHTDLCLSTVEERESLYSRKQLRKAQEAGEYLRALGYPSMNDAINIVRHGNVRNIPYGVEDVRRFFDI